MFITNGDNSYLDTFLFFLKNYYEYMHTWFKKKNKPSEQQFYNFLFVKIAL